MIRTLAEKSNELHSMPDGYWTHTVEWLVEGNLTVRVLTLVFKSSVKKIIELTYRRRETRRRETDRGKETLNKHKAGEGNSPK